MAALLGAALAVSGCNGSARGSTDTSASPAATAVSPRPVSTHTPPSAAGIDLRVPWRPYKDRLTGIRFALPGTPHAFQGTARLPIGHVQDRTYSVVLGPDHPTGHPLLILTVGVFSGRDVSANSAALPLKYFANVATEELRQKHAHRVRLLQVRGSSIAGHRSLSFRISYYVPNDNPAPFDLDPSNLYVQVLDADGTFVLLLVNVYQPVGGLDTISPVALRDLRARLLAGLHL